MIIDRLRRITTGGGWIPEIDGLRFVAILSVLLFHIGGELQVRSGRIISIEPRYSWLSVLLGNGDRGVILFFVISGMILALPFARHFLLGAKPVSLRKFYLRRVTRLEPPYILAILLSAAMILAYKHSGGPNFGQHVLATLFYQHNLIYGQLSPVNMVTWSLEVEIQFYLLAPFFMQLYRIRSAGLRQGLLLAAVLLAGLLQARFALVPHVYMSILFYVQYFLVGLLVAEVFVLHLDRMRSSWLWDAAGFAALAVFYSVPHDDYWPHAIMPFVIVILIVATMRSHLLRRVLANPWVSVTGGMCYSIYLLHFIWIAMIFKATRHAIVASASFPVNLAIQLLVTGAPAVALCVVFFVLIERPCMDPDWPSKAWHWVTGRSGREVAALDSGSAAP